MKLLYTLLFAFFLSCSTEPEDVHGCLDSTACNYNSSATIDNNSCEYESDCAGECGGSATYDECGVCNGDNSSCADCAGIPNGTSYLNHCNDCVSNSDWCINSSYSYDYNQYSNFSCTNINCSEISIIIDWFGESSENCVDEFGIKFTEDGFVHSIVNNNESNINIIPDSIFDFSELYTFWLSNAPLSALPNNIINATSLNGLLIYNCELNNLPNDIGNLANLTIFDLRRNNLESIPNSICQIPNIQNIIQLDGNSICGELPSCLTQEDIGEQNCP